MIKMPTIKEKQLEMLRMLKNIDRVCQENNIEYSLCAGSMLGAIRHKGFIPWDDDTDIMLDWNNYNKLLKVWDKSNHDNTMFLLSNENNNKYPFLFPKIVSRKMKIMEPILSGLGLEYGIWIDIFPVIVRGKEGKERKKQHRYIKWGNFLLHKYYYINSSNYVKNNHKYLGLKKFVFRLIPDKVCFGVAHKYINKAAVIGTSNDFFEIHDETYSYKKEILNNGIRYVKFEDTELPVLKSWNEYLTIHYGDWSTPVKYMHEFEE